MELFYDKIVNEINYESLGDWQIPNISSFSNSIKELFPYQVEAIKNVIKLLYLYYSSDNGKKLLYDKCIENGLEQDSFRIYDVVKRKQNMLFDIASKYYEIKNQDEKKYIDGYNIFNRACFWMATASGKTIIIIKMIEIIDYLQKIGYLPKNDIMILFPDSNIENQFKREVKRYNYCKSRIISVNSLKDYDNVKNSLSLLDDINVFIYRSDLLSTSEKDKQINVEAYDNEGKWFILLDEAHKGDKSGDSKRQNYITQWTRNGFLFNFSATFTDKIDYVTTVYNYNLEKFINDGYGKNIFVSNSYFTFNKKDELNDSLKQKQVLKSLITSTLIKKYKKDGFYHNPLIVTLVDTVNEEDSDLYMFFKEIEKIAVGTIDKQSFELAKEELAEEFVEGEKYSIGYDKIKGNYSASIKNITIKDVLKQIFNSDAHGKIEIKLGDGTKELALQLETSTTPFMLIKIGDATKFRKDKLSSNYQIGKSYGNNKYFNTINKNTSHINILLGSRAFYEGWDSNRPNVINFINIGSNDAKKFVLQSIGRGVRIQPVLKDVNNRKRAKANDSFKNELMETLFIYATNKTAINTILDTLDEQKVEDELVLNPMKINQKTFPLLVPEYKINENFNSKSKFCISKKCFEKVKEIFNSYDKILFMLLYNVSAKDYEYLKEIFKNKSIFIFEDYYNYKDIRKTLSNIIVHIKQKEHYVSKIRNINENDITHFKHIKTTLQEDKYNKLQNLINHILENSNNLDLNQIKNEFLLGNIDLEEYTSKIINYKKLNSKNDFESELSLYNIPNHYYSPLIVTANDKIKYIKHVINVDSEREFIENLNSYLEKNTLNFEWYFSKIDQTLDNIYIWYFNEKANKYDKFYPDFIFWICKKDKYDIYFVDPKGFQNVDYQFKIEGFKELFEIDEQSKIFKYKNQEIKFHLLMIGDTLSVPKPYKKYCISPNDFNWLK